MAPFTPDAAAEIELQGECGPLTAFVQVANHGAYITISSGTPIGIYGISGSSFTLLDTITLPVDVGQELSESIAVDINNWSSYTSIEAYIDDPIALPIAGALPKSATKATIRLLCLQMVTSLNKSKESVLYVAQL